MKNRSIAIEPCVRKVISKQPVADAYGSDVGFGTMKIEWRDWRDVHTLAIFTPRIVARLAHDRGLKMATMEPVATRK
jgi:hypothetical protein